jgi:hypothetical protein
MFSFARIDPGRQSMLDFKHRCSSVAFGDTFSRKGRRERGGAFSCKRRRKFRLRAGGL